MQVLGVLLGLVALIVWANLRKRIPWWAMGIVCVAALVLYLVGDRRDRQRREELEQVAAAEVARQAETSRRETAALRAADERAAADAESKLSAMRPQIVDTLTTIEKANLKAPRERQEAERQLGKLMPFLAALGRSGKAGDADVIAILKRLEFQAQRLALAGRGAEESAKAAELANSERAEKADKRRWEASRAGKLCKKYPAWSRDDCKGVAGRQYWRGMTIEMLKASRGRPDSATPSDYGSGVSWQWCWHDYTPSCFYDNNDDGIIDSYN